MDVSLLNFITLEPGIKKDTIILPSFKIPLKKLPPKKKFISIYGTKSTSAALSTARHQAIKDSSSLYRVDIEIDGGNLPRGKINLENLSSINFLNIERIMADLASVMMDILLINGDPSEYRTPIKILAEEPKRFDLLWSDPLFAHITTFSWNAPTTSSKPHRSLKLAVTKDVNCFKNVAIRNYKNEKGVPKIEFAV